MSSDDAGRGDEEDLAKLARSLPPPGFYLRYLRRGGLTDELDGHDARGESGTSTSSDAGAAPAAEQSRAGGGSVAGKAGGEGATAGGKKKKAAAAQKAKQKWNHLIWEKGSSSTAGEASGAKEGSGPPRRFRARPCMPAENNVLVCDGGERERIALRSEVDSKKERLLGTMTEQLKIILTRFAAGGLTEFQKASYRALMAKIKGELERVKLAPDGGSKKKRLLHATPAEQPKAGDRKKKKKKTGPQQAAASATPPRSRRARREADCLLEWSRRKRRSAESAPATPPRPPGSWQRGDGSPAYEGPGPNRRRERHQKRAPLRPLKLKPPPGHLEPTVQRMGPPPGKWR